MSFPTNYMYRTIPQLSQEPAWHCASGSSLQKRKFCSMTTSLLSITSFTRCVQTKQSFLWQRMYFLFLFFLTVPYLCRPQTMWRKASSKQSRSSTSCKSWRSRRRCPWLVSHPATLLLFMIDLYGRRQIVTHCSQVWFSVTCPSGKQWESKCDLRHKSTERKRAYRKCESYFLSKIINLAAEVKFTPAYKYLHLIFRSVELQRPTVMSTRTLLYGSTAWIQLNIWRCFVHPKLQAAAEIYVVI